MSNAKNNIDYEYLNMVSTASLHEAYDKKGALPYNIKPINSKMKLYGIAFPVQLYPGSNYLLHRAIYEAPENSVIIVSTGGHIEYGYWGEIMTVAAIQKNIRGLVIDGCIRDSTEIIKLNFPVFCSGISIQGTSKQKARAQKICNSIIIDNVTINFGDLILGDADGVVIIPKDEITIIIDNVIKIEKEEKEFLKLLKMGYSTLELFKLD